MGGVVTGSFTFLDPYDDRVGVLVAPDIDHHIDRFEAGFFVNVTFTISKLMTQGGNVEFQVFCTDLLPSEKYFNPNGVAMPTPESLYGSLLTRSNQLAFQSLPNLVLGRI